jgi:5-methylcytosine-specific restriction endonuclease McrA
MMNFEFIADKNFFEELFLKDRNDTFEKYQTLFDFRPPSIKRQEFYRVRNTIYNELLKQYGERCMLNLEVCDVSSGFAVDHLIPLSTNKLNKNLRNVKPEPGKKVKTQSFGSNHPDNLILSCNSCNNRKKHRILEREKVLSILSEKSNGKH